MFYLKNNILKLILFILIFFPFYSFANDCKIKDAMAPTLLEYLSNVDTVTNSIISSAKSGERDNSVTSKALNYVTASLGKIIDFGDLYSSFDFNVSLPITNEVPAEIKRDHEKLTKKTEDLIDNLRDLVESGYGKVKVTDPCSGIDNCSLNGSAKELLVDIIKNNKEIIKFYRYNILDKKYIFKESIILTPTDFESQMGEYYNKDTLSDCSKYEGGFMEEVLKKIEDIGKMFTNGYEGYSSWEEAFDLLKGINDENKEKETEVLKKYLNSVGMDKKHSDIILDNLEKYNLGGLSDSDPISNSVNYSFNNLNVTKDAFVTAITKLFENGETKIATEKVKNLIPEIQATVDIENEINNIFKPEIYLAIPQDSSTQNLQLEIIKMHFYLTEAIKTLSEVIPKSEKVCRQQGGECNGSKCSFKD